MAAGGNTSTVVTVLVGTGLLTAISESVRWFLSGRGRARVDTAKIVQGMALDLLRPLHEELAAANMSANELRATMTKLRTDMEAVIDWALIARALLDRHNEHPTAAPIAYPAIPHVMVKRTAPPGSF